LSCLVWRCELSRPDHKTGAFCVGSTSQCISHGGGGHAGSAFETAAAAMQGQLGLATRTTTRSDVVCHAKMQTRCKCNDCCIRLGLNFFDTCKCHATFRLHQTVSRLNSHHLIRHRQDCLVMFGGRCKLGINVNSKQVRACLSMNTCMLRQTDNAKTF